MKSLFALFLLVTSTTVFADDRPTIDSILGKVFFVEDHWAGQSFEIVNNGGNLVMVWKVHGSGVPVVEETTYPLEIRSDWQVVTKDNGTDCQKQIKVSIFDEGEVRVYIDGIRLYLRN